MASVIGLQVLTSILEIQDADFIEQILAEQWREGSNIECHLRAATLGDGFDADEPLRAVDVDWCWDLIAQTESGKRPLSHGATGAVLLLTDMMRVNRSNDCKDSAVVLLAQYGQSRNNAPEIFIMRRFLQGIVEWNQGHGVWPILAVSITALSLHICRLLFEQDVSQSTEMLSEGRMLRYMFGEPGPAAATALASEDQFDQVDMELRQLRSLYSNIRGLLDSNSK